MQYKSELKLSLLAQLNTETERYITFVLVTFVGNICVGK